MKQDFKKREKLLPFLTWQIMSSTAAGSVVVKTISPRKKSHDQNKGVLRHNCEGSCGANDQYESQTM